MITLTQEKIDKATPWEILAFGYFENTPEWVYLTNHKDSRKKVKFVAVRGEVPDWAIYYEDIFDNWDHWENTRIARTWCKLLSCDIEKVMKVDELALKTYRK